MRDPDEAREAKGTAEQKLCAPSSTGCKRAWH